MDKLSEKEQEKRELILFWKEGGGKLKEVTFKKKWINGY